MIKKISRTFRYIKLLQNGHKGLKSTQATSDEHITKARRLHARVYLESGYIEPHHVDGEGHIKREYDPYHEHSTYFVVIEENDGKQVVVAVARQIMGSELAEHASLPTLSKLQIKPAVKREIEKMPSGMCVEISALSKVKGYTSYAALMLYREMWQYSIRHSHQLWIMACDARAFDRLKFLFGDTLINIGEKTFYMGSDVIPAALDVQRSLTVIQKYAHGINPIRRHLYAKLVKFFLDGLSESDINRARQENFISTIVTDEA